MKTSTFNVTYHLAFLLLFALLGCNSSREEIESLNADITELKQSNEHQRLELRKVTEEADSLKTILHTLKNQVIKLSGDKPEYQATSEEEASVEALVRNLHNGWESMFKTRDMNDLLRYFLPKYTTSTIRINPDNTPAVRRSNNTNFEEQLQELLAANNLSVSFGQTQFLYTEVRGNIFVTTYRFRIRVYSNNEEIYTSSIVTLLAGENSNGWKVGGYDWVTFNYE